MSDDVTWWRCADCTVRLDKGRSCPRCGAREGDYADDGCDFIAADLTEAGIAAWKRAQREKWGVR